MEYEKIKAVICGVDVTLDVLVRRGSKPAVLILHGFGSTKEEYADLVLCQEFSGRTVVVYDAPGFGASDCAKPGLVTVDFLCRAAERVVDHYDLGPYHLAGHSMGGLTALKLATKHSKRLLSFTSIEGNLAPEDCFFSRQILEKPDRGGKRFLDDLIEQLRSSEDYSSAFYAANLPGKVNPDVIGPVFRTMVELTDNDSLLGQFLDLPCPTMFVYGDTNQGLSYLPKLRKAGVTLRKIQHSAHFPMYSNPQVLWQALGEFFTKAERKCYAG